MRRILLRLALVLTLGLLTTVASALALAVWMPFAMYPRHRSYHFIADGRPWNAVERSTRGVHHFWWSELNAECMLPPPPPKRFFRDTLRSLAGGRPEAPTDDRPTTPQGWIDLARRQIAESNADSRRARKLEVPAGAPAWGTFAGGKAAARTVAAGSDHGYGWPLPALWYRVHGTYVRMYAFGTEIQGGRLLTGPESLELRAYNFRALPYFVHWRGLLADTVLFAALWWVLLFARGDIRRALRRRRGLCIVCGYDRSATRTDAPCPECGLPPTPGRNPAKPPR